MIPQPTIEPATQYALNARRSNSWSFGVFIVLKLLVKFCTGLADVDVSTSPVIHERAPRVLRQVLAIARSDPVCAHPVALHDESDENG